MARHAQLKFVMTECSKTQIRLTGLIQYYTDAYKLKSKTETCHYQSQCIFFAEECFLPSLFALSLKHPAGDVTRVSVMPRKVTVKIVDAENQGCQDKNR